MRVLICNECGRSNSEFNVECNACGKPLPADSVAVPNGGRREEETVSFQDWPSSYYGDDPLQPGDQVAHFEVLEKVGQGGMGTVYKARDTQLDRFVAIKVFRAFELSANDGFQYLLKEAKLASALNHPNIVTVHDIARNNALDFIAMEWLEGKTLNKLIPEKGMLLSQTIDYARQVAEGLSFAHEHGIIHRDIKPQNLIVTRGGELKILDFGVARFQEETELRVLSHSPTPMHETAHGVLKGTMPYMSPEQVRGDKIDARSDIFSFGVLLYQMLAGFRPFQGENLQKLSDQILESDPPPLENARKDLPPRIQALVLKCLEKDSAKRFRSMREIIALLPRRQSDLRGLKTEVVVEQRRIRTKPAAIIGLAAALILFLAWRFLPFSQTPADVTGVPADKIAVAPFENISGDPQGAVFCDGLTVTLSGQLTRLQRYRVGLWVVPSPEIRRFGKDTGTSQYERLGVDLVISGSVQQLGEHHRLVIELIQAPDRRLLASRSIDLQDQQLFSMQDQALDIVLELLGWELSENVRMRLSSGTTQMSGAYRHFLRGQGYLYRYDLEKNVERAVREMQRAIEIDDAYTPAYIGLSEACRLRWRATRDPAWLERAADALAGAEEMILDPEDISLTVQRGLLYKERGEYQRGRELLQQALFWDPTHDRALSALAQVYTHLNLREEAEQTYLRALRQQPNNWSLRNRLGSFYYTNGLYKKAEEIFTQLTEITPGNPLGYSNLAAVYQVFERNDEALVLLEKARELSPRSPSVYANMGSLLFYRKRYKESVAKFERYVELRQNRHDGWGNLADAYRWAGGYDQQAVEAYQKAIVLARNQLKVNPNLPEPRIHIAYYLAKLGEIPEALLQLDALPPITDPSLLYYLGIVYELAGERDKAIAHLQDTLNQGYGSYMMRNDPELEALRKDSRFNVLMETGHLQ